MGAAPSSRGAAIVRKAVQGPGEGWFGAIVESSVDPIISTTVQGFVTSWNGAAEGFYGYAVDEVLGQHLAFLVPRQRRPEMSEALIQAARRSTIDRVQAVHVAKNGVELSVTVSVKPLLSPVGEVMGIVLVTHGPGDQTTADQARAAAELRFQAAFRRSAFGMAIADLDGVTTTVNPAVCNLLGRSATELTGNRWERFTHPDDLDQAEIALAGFRRGHESVSFECRYIRPEGTEVWVLSNTTLVRDASERPSFFLAQLQDITERKRTESQLEHRALHDELTGLPNRTLLMDRLGDW